MIPLLQVENLSVTYAADAGPLHALRGAHLTAQAGEVIGIVGESGCGKSTLAAALITLLAANARVTSGEIRLNGQNILALAEPQKRAIRGSKIAMIFQDPMTAFNPVLPLGLQLTDYQHHLPHSRAQKLQRAAAMLARTGIPDPARILTCYMHELSGGMRQRAAIAAALLMTPDVLVADEPTTALDVTMEAQIIHLLRDLRTSHHGTILVITHHLGVVGELCDRVYVMYAGQVVEEATTDDLYHHAKHPYTRALIACDPAHLATHTPILPTIPGRLPDPAAPPAGCAFAPRCPQAMALCATPPPYIRLSPTQSALCHLVTP